MGDFDDNHVIPAEIHSDDHVFEVRFDAEPWFKQASASQILDLYDVEWGGDYAADVIGQHFEDKIPEVGELFRYLGRKAGMKNAPGFEVHVKGSKALEWLSANRLDVYNVIKEYK